MENNRSVPVYFPFWEGFAVALRRLSSIMVTVSEGVSHEP